jgi:hypothetical protein
LSSKPIDTLIVPGAFAVDDVTSDRAATRWMHAPLLATRHPRVTVEPDAIFVRDGAILVVRRGNHGN